MRILITDGDTRSALAATRSLGKRGHEIIVASERIPCLSSSSRHCSDRYTYPSPLLYPDGFVDRIVHLATECTVHALLPMTEVSTLLLAENRKRLPTGAQLPLASAEAIAKASNKAEVIELARNLQVAIPETLTIESAAQIDAIATKLKYPTVIKPARSRIRTSAGYIPTSVSYARDAADLIRRIRTAPAIEFPLLLQERIEGPGVGVFACYEDDKPRALFAHRRLREKPPSGGVSVLRESAALDARAVESANRLLEALDWRGVAMVEFKRDVRDNSLKLMEINGRFWGSLQLAIDAGVDFPAILMDIVAGQPPASPPEYRIGVRSRWFWGDVDSLLAVLLHSRSALNLPESHPTRLRLLWDFMHLFGKKQFYEVFRRDDIAPWLLETRRWFGIHK